MSLYVLLGHRILNILHIRSYYVEEMTNPSIAQRPVFSDDEVTKMIKKADKIKNTYFRLRSKALISLFDMTGKRRIEVSRLRQDDAKIKDSYLRVNFTIAKTRTKKTGTGRAKLLLLKDQRTQHILEYVNWMRANHFECRYLFPRTHNIFGVDLVFYPDEHISGRHILRLIHDLDPEVWCHLFREKRGATIVREDPTIMAPFKVMIGLDLKTFEVAFNYMRRYAEEKIGSFEQEEEIIT